MPYQDKPDNARCVAIVTKAALHEMRKPSILVLGTPIAVGLVFKWYGMAVGQPRLGVEVLAGMLMFGTLTALLMASFFDNRSAARHAPTSNALILMPLLLQWRSVGQREEVY